MNEERHSRLFSALENLSALLTQYGLRPADLWNGLSDEYPELQNSWEKAFDLYDDDLVNLVFDAKLISLEKYFCEDKAEGDKSRCVKRVRMLVTLEDYMAAHQDDLLNVHLWEKSPITIKYPKVHSILDDDRLFDVSEAKSLEEDRLGYENDLFFYHPALSHHFRQQFLAFCEGEVGCAKKIALDPRKMLPARKYPTPILADYWYGPKFNLTQVDEPIHGIELTVHTRLPDSKRNLVGLRLDRTEFLWSLRENLKTLQIEEIVPFDEKEHTRRVAARYIHTIRDIEHQTFTHLDGAIRWYLPSNYVRRCATKLSDHPDADGYFKLFRIDGEIPNQDWLDLIANFFSGNELIHEYFGQPMQR